LTTVPAPAPFQAAEETIALRVAVRPPSPSAIDAWPRLSTRTLGSLSQVRRAQQHVGREAAGDQAGEERQGDDRGDAGEQRALRGVHGFRLH
jgi:hypothetical protein